MAQCTVQHVQEEILRCVVNWGVPMTRHPWGEHLLLSSNREDSDSLELLPMAHVCQAWRAAIQPQIWRHIRVTSTSGIHTFELLTRMPWLRDLIRNLAVELSWLPARHEALNWEPEEREIRGELEDYYFGDRQAVLNRLVEAGHVGNGYEDREYYENFENENGKMLEFSQGPDGTGFHPIIKTADDAIESLVSSFLRLSNLQRVAWETDILPMPSSVCLHLSQLDSLRLLRLAEQGEFRSSKRLPAPLWEIFGPDKQLDALGLGIRVLPLYENVTHETAFDDRSHTLRRAIGHKYRDVEIPFSQPDHLFSATLDAVPPIERPLAMATRLLEACANQSRVRLVCLVWESECLLRFRHLAHIWIKLPVTTEAATLAYGREPHLNRWVSAANGMRPALMELASSKQDRSLTTSDIASLPEGRKELDPFADWLRKDQKVQERVASVWNDIVQEGKDRNLPRAFSVQLVNEFNKGWDDRWLYWTVNPK